MKLVGRVWRFGDDINTDLILPIPVIPLPLEDRPQHMFRAHRPGWRPRFVAETSSLPDGTTGWDPTGRLPR